MDLSRRAVLLGLPSVALTGAGCTSAGRASPAFTAAEERSLASLRLVDPRLPLFSMTMYAAYDPMRPLAIAPEAAGRPWACSLFLAGKGPRGPLFGRNFDWDPNPALLLTTESPRSISLVDISYLGIGRTAAKGLLTDRSSQRKLLQAAVIPFDGVNAHGLAIGMAAVPTAVAPRLPGRPTVGSARIQRLVLDQARTVDEAVTVFGRHNVEFGPGEPRLHYLLADAGGRSAAIEFVEGRMKVIPGAGDWHDLVNFVLSGAGEGTKRDDRRYRTIADRLRAAGGRLDPNGAMDLLANVAQVHTRWSAVYELRHGQLHLCLGRDYRRAHRFALSQG